MIERKLTIEDNRQVAAATYQMVLSGDMPELAAGSFVEVALPHQFLRRPISVCASEPQQLTLLYKVVGTGTRQMAALQPGETLNCLLQLGNGFSICPPRTHALLVGGGIGVAPLYQLAKTLKQQNHTVTLVAGFNTQAEIFWQEAFANLCDSVRYTTLDGTCGTKGMVTDVLPELSADYFYACGPTPMLKAVSAALPIAGELSLEERMGCGFGICMGCSIQTTNGAKRVCKEGPVFKKEELLW